MVDGVSTLSNCAIEPEIKDLVKFINQMGGKIKWIGKRTVRIYGVNKFKNVKYKIMADRIEAGTYMIAAAATQGKLKIKGINPKIIKTEIDILRKVGTKIESYKNEIKVSGSKKINNINIKTAPYPGFPTDLQAQLMVLLCKAKKHSIITEEIFENRFMHVGELNRMGAKINIKGNKAIIAGNTNFKGAQLMATDLRASVSLIIAALTSKGKSIINRIYHLDRGYEKIEKKLKNIGAKIKRIS
tara:strand:- start:24 stop:752 length:729 start_codon:yes stop_codon:yes gene_type:complete